MIGVKRIRVVFELESVKDADSILAHIETGILMSELKLEGNVSGGCEIVETLDLGYGESK